MTQEVLKKREEDLMRDTDPLFDGVLDPFRQKFSEWACKISELEATIQQLKNELSEKEQQLTQLRQELEQCKANGGVTKVPMSQKSYPRETINNVDQKSASDESEIVKPEPIRLHLTANSQVLYASAADDNGCFKCVQKMPFDTAIYRIVLETESALDGYFGIFEENVCFILNNKNVLNNACSVSNAAGTSSQNIKGEEYGKVKLHEDNKWKVVKKLKIKIV